MSIKDLSKEELEQLLPVFRDQSLQLIEEMSQDLLVLESTGPEDELINRVKRAAHTIKGDSACIGLDGVTDLAHKLEDIIDAIGQNEINADRRVIDLLLDALDAVKEAVSRDDLRDIPAEDLSLLGERIASLSGEEPVAAATPPVPAEVAGGDDDGRAPKIGEAPKRAAREYVRVEAVRIDSLMNLAGEMVIARSVLNQLGPELEEDLPKSEIAGRFNGASSQLGKLISELQKSVLKMRMVTIDHVFQRFVRPMRELAVEHGKQVEMTVRGGETELDRTLVDLLYEPLLHLLRNAVDHGIETSQDRESLGKPAAGHISLRAYHEGNQVVVEIKDDGRGVDVDALKAKAIKMGALTATDAGNLTEEDAYELMFLPGITTASKITQISGRGIGASTVKNAVEQMRGSVSAKSELGHGTTFVLRMPLTLAIIKALLFKATGQLLAVPLLTVSEVARIKSDEITHLDGLESYRLRDRFISLVRPGSVLGFDRRRGGTGTGLRGGPESLFIIVLMVGAKRYGIVADTLIGEQELVIKPLESHWVQSDALAGASVLGDGRVVLIMDAGMVFRKAVRHERARGARKRVYGT